MPGNDTVQVSQRQAHRHGRYGARPWSANAVCDSVCREGARRTDVKRGFLLVDREGRRRLALQGLRVLDGIQRKAAQRLIAGLVVALFFALLTLERIGLYSVLKAIGASTRQIFAGVVLQAVLVAHLHGNAAQVSVEIGRGQIPSEAQPSFAELEEALNAVTV